MRAKPIIFLGVAAAGLGLLTPSSARAAAVTFDLVFEFSGATAPEGAAPWLTVRLDDGGMPGSVDLTLADANLTDAEFVQEWLLNLDPALDPTALVFSAPTKTGAFTDPIVNTGVNAFMVDGDGQFDIQFDFNTSDGAPTRFGVGDSVDYTITGIASLTVSSFDFLSKMGGGGGRGDDGSDIMALIDSINGGIAGGGGGGRGRSTGKRIHNALSVVKVVDKSSPKLYQALCTGEHMKNGTLPRKRPGRTIYVPITLRQARIVDIRPYMPMSIAPQSESYPRMEEGTFTYRKIIWTWEPDGIKAEDSWQMPK